MTFVERTPQDALGPLNSVEEKNAPQRLFLVGNESLLVEGCRVSIVGSRKASPEAIKRTASLARMLVKEGIVILSGLAEGIDAAAHKAAIEAGGKTIGVIGTPLNQSYPAINRGLQAQIAREHLLVTQFPIGYPVGRKNFPMRNRTMALIADATVIVEAKDGSGSLHQGWEALRLGRPLFIMESVLRNESLEWPDKLMSYGARVLTRDDVADLIESLPKASRADLAAFAF